MEIFENQQKQHCYLETTTNLYNSSDFFLNPGMWVLCLSRALRVMFAGIPCAVMLSLYSSPLDDISKVHTFFCHSCRKGGGFRDVCPASQPVPQECHRPSWSKGTRLPTLYEVLGPAVGSPPEKTHPGHR